MAQSGSDVRWVATPHGEVAVRDTGGEGPPVLLVHSLLLDGDLYARLVPRLVAAGQRCLVPDLPLGAHGRPLAAGADLSPQGLATLLVEVLDALGLAQVDVVGVDTGGALTQLLMAHHRDRVGRVVLTACDAYEEFPPRSFAWAVRPLRSGAGLAVLAAVLAVAPLRRGYNARPFTHAGVDAAQRARWARPLRLAGIRRDLQQVCRHMHPSATLAAAEANRDFPRPVLVAWGDDDRVFPRSLGERLAADLPHAELTTLADCAAFAALDQPAELARLVERHLAAV